LRNALQNRLYDCTKFDRLIRYRCANLSFLVRPNELFRGSEIPVGWGALVESDGVLKLIRNPSGRNQPWKIEFPYYSESPWPEREQSIDNWKSPLQTYEHSCRFVSLGNGEIDSRPDSGCVLSFPAACFPA
jgi:hypothetical protein